MAAVGISSATLGIALLLFAICSAAVDGAHHGGHAAAPGPAVDCSSLIMNMADCLSFVSSGSTASKPEGSCCSGLKTVLKTDAECLCEVFKSSASLGVTLNVTKALTLPTACKLHAPSVANCGLSVSPAGAPGLSPAAGPESAGSTVQPPALSPQNAAASLFQFSVASLFSGVLVLLFSAF